MASLKNQIHYLNPYDLHKLLMDKYVLKNQKRGRNDYDVIKENHKFLWDEDESADSWELNFAKKYYDKLFKEYCIGDLSLYKENKIALRWRIEKEVVVGKGQFICGNKKCDERENLRSWEVNFTYNEQNKRKNALVKIRLCPDCSKKLNYHSRKREIKRLLKKTRIKHNVNASTSSTADAAESTSVVALEDQEVNAVSKTTSTEIVESPWETHKVVETKSREEEMDEYLQDLLL